VSARRRCTVERRRGKEERRGEKGHIAY